MVFASAGILGVLFFLMMLAFVYMAVCFRRAEEKLTTSNIQKDILQKALSDATTREERLIKSLEECEARHGACG